MLRLSLLTVAALVLASASAVGQGVKVVPSPAVPPQALSDETEQLQNDIWLFGLLTERAAALKKLCDTNHGPASLCPPAPVIAAQPTGAALVGTPPQSGVSGSSEAPLGEAAKTRPVVVDIGGSGSALRAILQFPDGRTEVAIAGQTLKDRRLVRSVTVNNVVIADGPQDLRLSYSGLSMNR